jgi:hypothetical protein
LQQRPNPAAFFRFTQHLFVPQLIDRPVQHLTIPYVLLTILIYNITQ